MADALKEAMWFDHIPISRVDPRELVACDLVEFSSKQMSVDLGGGVIVLGTGGPQCNGFVVPEYLGADIEFLAMGAEQTGGARNVMY